jgi:mono/diheme cytochrome c family protein
MRRAIGIGLLILAPWCASAQTAPQPALGLDVFDAQVRPLLTGKCLSCHAGEKAKGGLDLTRRASALAGGDGGEAVVPGKPADSLLFEKVAAGEMPPKDPLTPDQVAAFRTWIEAGAPYASEPLAARRAGPDWWSLRKVVRPAVPKVADPARWCRTPVDAFVLAKLNEHGLAPAPNADRAALVRRVSFDLTGLPPTPEEVSGFVDDAKPDAYERMVDRLLDSPRYGERWGRHWLDVVRFGESHGYETNSLRPNAWPYRDYVIRAFNRDTPLPRFMLEQLAGDTLADGDWLTQAATGFLVGGTHDTVGNQTIEGQLQQRADDLDDMITATATTFLGLTVNCARCHDHKFDPISQRDYYGLQAVLAGVQHSDRAVPVADESRKRAAVRIAAELALVERRLDAIEPLARPDLDVPGRAMVNPQRNVERFPPVSARGVRITILATNGTIEPCIDEIEVLAADDSARNVALASAGGKASASSEYPNAAIHKIAHLNDGLVGNSNSWISRAASRGWAQVEWPKATAIDRVVWGRDREGKFQDRLATEYYLEVQTEAGRWSDVASSADRPAFRAGRDPQPPGTSKEVEERTALLKRQQELRDQLATMGPTQPVYAGTFMQPGPTNLLRRGDPMQKGDPVAPSALAAVAPPLTIAADAPEAERRRALALWLGDPANPLPARVMVNRVWHYHFGRGLVATPSDFGFNGGLPSHPELLDWLAAEYIGNGFHLKPLHRLIVRSAAYRQASRPDAKKLTVDRENRWLWRMTPRRLEAEAIRDAVLAAGGRLDRRMGGPGYSIWEKNTNYVVVFKPKTELGPEESRRMVYQFKPRSQQDPTFGAFDCPDAALVAPRRNVSTTALQALNLLNSRFLIDQARFFADRLKADAGDDPSRQAERGFLLAFGRAPTNAEHAAAVSLVREHGAATFCRALYNANEFIYVP